MTMTIAKLRELTKEFDRAALSGLDLWFQRYPDLDDPFYRVKVGQTLFSGLQEQMLLWMLDAVSRDKTIVEIGAGMGQFPLFLSAQGFKTMGTEVSTTRYEGMLFLREHLSSVYEGLSERCAVSLRKFPGDAPPADVLVFCNIVNSRFHADLDNVIEAFKQYEEIVLDLRTFGITRDDDEAQRELCERISTGRPVSTIVKSKGCHVVRILKSQSI